MTITQTVDIPADYRLRLDVEVPRNIPIGKTQMIIQFPVQQNIAEPTAVTPKTNNNSKFLITKTELDEMIKNSPITQSLGGILSDLGDVDLDEIRLKRLAKHL